MAKLESVSPISDEDIMLLPVKDLATAIAYYESVLGFVTVTRNERSVSLRRDEAEIGLIVDGSHEPHKAESLAFLVDHLDALHKELTDRGTKPGAFDVQEWGGNQFRTFFVREDQDGYCYCFYHPV